MHSMLAMLVTMLVGGLIGWMGRGSFERGPAWAVPPVTALEVTEESSSATPRLPPMSREVRSRGVAAPFEEVASEAPPEDPCEDRVRALERQLDELKRRVRHLERLGKARVERYRELEAALEDESLHHPEVYRPFLDYLIAPELLAEDPEGFLDAIDQAMLVARIPSLPKEDWGGRVMPLEDRSSNRFSAEVSSFWTGARDSSGQKMLIPTEQLRIELELPESLGAVEIQLSAGREWDELRWLTLKLGDLDPQFFDPHFSLYRREDGSVELDVATANRMVELPPERIDPFLQHFETWYRRSGSALR